MKLAIQRTDRITDEELRVRARVERILIDRFGRVQEELVAAGILDSLKTIELALALESEFGVPLDELTTQDTMTLSALVRTVMQLRRGG
jgi:acyl carrier protein